MRSLRTRVAVVLAALSLVAAAAPAASVQAESGSPQATAAHRCSSGYTHAHLPWGQKCLRAGQFCKRTYNGVSANRWYHRYDFHCKRNGHLTDW
jgi:hypothetical protein